MGTRYEGLVVQIKGARGPAEPYDVDAPLDVVPSDVNGQLGRCVGWHPRKEKCIVQLFSAVLVLVEEEHLEEANVPVPEEGGFDLVWPSDLPDGQPASEGLPMFAYMLMETVNRKGWCLVQRLADDLTTEEAVDQALSLPDFTCPKAELLPEYLGRGGSGKISILDYNGLNGLKLDDTPWALADLDRELTCLAKALAPLTEQGMGFKSCGRRKGMVVMPFASASESEQLRPEPLSDEDVDAGLLEAHLQFIQRRRLCFMNWVHNRGGELVLHPRPDFLPGSEVVRLPVTPGKLLVFRADWFAYSYAPMGNTSVALVTWVMDDGTLRSRPTFGHLAGSDPQLRSEALGILVGPPMPMGYRMHIMAMHSHTPGGVHNIDDFVNMITAGTDGFVKIPYTRFDTDIYCSPDGEKDYSKSYVIHGAMLTHEEVSMFDNVFFGIQDEEAKRMSPAQRLIMENGYLALQKAGFTKQSLVGRRTGAYLGDTGTDWSPWNLLQPAERPTGHVGSPFGNMSAHHLTISGIDKSFSASRLSHILGLKGATTSIDTACSASLVGVATAVQGMRRVDGNQAASNADKHDEDAICMGISTLMSPMTFIGLCGPSMLAKRGRCFTFDVSAEGYARGDGFGAVYVKPSDSEDDNVNQLACLMGCHVNQDGRSATLTAPNGMAQQACIKDSMRDAGVVANQITIAECHGTGTALGDPIEVGALRGVMEPRETPLLTTSAKSNIGHLEACAGVIGLIKCITMVLSSTSPPNCHLRTLNPHLDVDSFPAFFETDASDTRLHSNYAGVSSFGFSGTNARADVWSQCRIGPRKTLGRLDPSRVDQFHAVCPVTMGFIEHLTGEPVTSSFRKRRRYKADVLREEWASYDVSRYAYEGDFRYRKDPPLEDKPEDLDADVGLFVCGSWSGWTKTEELEPEGGGWYGMTVLLGEGRYELFYLMLNRSSSMELYPIVKNATHRIWIEGPDHKRNGRCWIIDGRDDEIPSGSAYRIRFRWHSESKRISWDRLETVPASLTAAFEHVYSLVGTFSSGRFVEMNRIYVDEGVWERTFRIGLTGAEEFQIARDNDRTQLVYPAKHQAMRTTVPVRGPDDLGDGKRWLVRGPSNDLIRVRLQVVDARIMVTVSSDMKGDKVWESVQGWDRHQYCILGSWTDGLPVTMVLDPDVPGVFRAFGKLRGVTRDGSGAFCEVFRVIIDQDEHQAIYPQADGSDSGEFIAMGPDSEAEGRSWAVRSFSPDARFEIVLDLTAVDRRKIVTWRWMGGMADPGGETEWGGLLEDG